QGMSVPPPDTSVDMTDALWRLPKWASACVTEVGRAWQFVWLALQRLVQPPEQAQTIGLGRRP
ncbi:MAG: hypothetical protein AB8G99_22640, partial [Planctomycetaceae bacterium]